MPTAPPPQPPPDAAPDADAPDADAPDADAPDADAPDTDAPGGAPGAADPRPDIAVGWVQAGPLDELHREAFKEARRRVAAQLRREVPRFAWSFPLVQRRDLGAPDGTAEPVALLDAGATERRLAGWDFALVVTAADLHARHRPFALATPSQALDTAALSLARLDPGVRDRKLPPEQRRETLARRLAALALHAFGHLNGLAHTAAPTAVMHPPRSPADLDTPLAFTDANRAEMEAELADVADPRMEEETALERLGDAAFAARTLVVNWADVADTVVQTRPWRFPFQLSKLTTAAFSTLIVLVMTAEAWDLGTRQPAALIAALSLGAMLSTSGYLVRKQGLLGARHGPARSEQRIVQAASVLLSLVLGMATTYGLLFGTTLALAALFFDAEIMAGWTASLGADVGERHVLVFAGFVASIGLAVGALGGSFEDQTYFRHVAYVDEET